MDTLFTDLFGLIDNHLDITQTILLQPTHATNEFDPLKEIKVWLHLYKRRPNQATKILYKKKDLRTLQFISWDMYHKTLINMILLQQEKIDICNPDVVKIISLLQENS